MVLLVVILESAEDLGEVNFTCPARHSILFFFISFSLQIYMPRTRRPEGEDDKTFYEEANERVQVVNPRTMRKIYVGSRVFNRLVREGIFLPDGSYVRGVPPTPAQQQYALPPPPMPVQRKTKKPKKSKKTKKRKKKEESDDEGEYEALLAEHMAKLRLKKKKSESGDESSESESDSSESESESSESENESGAWEVGW